MSKIIFCQMTMNRLAETRVCVEKYLDYVDKVVIVDGGSIDDTIFYFRNWAAEEPKISFTVIPWKDRFYEQRTNYLRIADTFSSPGDHLLVSDPDELLETKTLDNLRKVATYLEKNDRNVGCFRSRDISMKGPKVVHENLADYWKHLFYRWEPGMYYVGNPHETMVIPSGFNPVQFDLAYTHTKQENVTWHRGARNFFVWGVGRNKEMEPDKCKMGVWLSMREACAEAKAPERWHDFDSYFLRGNISTTLKNWLITNRAIEGFEFASEAREMYKLYFRIYHPEEEPDELKKESL